MRLTNSVKFTLAFITLLIGLWMIGAAWRASGPVEESATQARARVASEKRRQAEELQHRRDLLSKQIATLISVEFEANRAAIARAENDLRETFKKYADRTPQFAAAVTDWTNQFKIAFLGLKDWWADTNEVETVTAELFAKHVVSDQQSVTDLKKIISQFQKDLAANRNRMLSEAALRIREADLGIPDLRLSKDALAARLSEREKEALSRMVGNAPWNSLLSVGGSMIAGQGTEMLVVQVIRIASGSMATGAATGGSAGSLMPGVGTAVGIAIGAAIGIAADHWMTERMAIKIEEEARHALDSMRFKIWNNPTAGLKVKFGNLVKLTKDTHEQVLHGVVTEEKS